MVLGAAHPAPGAPDLRASVDARHVRARPPRRRRALAVIPARHDHSGGRAVARRSAPARVIRLLPRRLVGAVARVRPVLVSNVRHDWWSRDIGHTATRCRTSARVGRVLHERPPVRARPTRARNAALVPLEAAAHSCSTRRARWPRWLGLVIARATGIVGIELLLVILVTFPFVYAVLPADDVQAPRRLRRRADAGAAHGCCAPGSRTEAQAILVSVWPRRPGSSRPRPGCPRRGRRRRANRLRSAAGAWRRRETSVRSSRARPTRHQPVLRELLARLPHHVRERWPDRCRRHAPRGARDTRRRCHPASRRSRSLHSRSRPTAAQSRRSAAPAFVFDKGFDTSVAPTTADSPDALRYGSSGRRSRSTIAAPSAGHGTAPAP